MKILIVLGTFITVWCGIITHSLMKKDALRGDIDAVIEKAADDLYNEVGLELCKMYSGTLGDGYYYFGTGAYDYADSMNIYYSVYTPGGTRIGGNYYLDFRDRDRATKLSYDNEAMGSKDKIRGGRYIYLMFRGEDTPENRLYYMNPMMWFNLTYRYFIAGGIVLGIVMILIGVIFFVRRRLHGVVGREHTVKLELPLVLYGLGIGLLMTNLGQIVGQEAVFEPGRFVAKEQVLYALCAASGVLILLHFIDRIWGHGQWYQKSVLFRFGYMLWQIVRNLPRVIKVLLLYLIFCGLEVGALFLFVPAGETRRTILIILGVEKLILGIGIMYYIVVFTQFEKAARALADGDLDYRMKTNYIPGLFRTFSRDMNSVGDSVSATVEERMKSELMKTELVTNVTHDLKTPLTSIINFADLIQKEESDNPKIAEYSEHLYQQSTRLKRLIENLLEVSKATTGNLEVHPEVCELRVLMGQCVGEYESRLQQQGIEICLRQSEKPVRIIADPKLLVRILENLMSNICKYAQENTRVFLTTEQRGSRARVIMMNTSKYALDMSPESLMERFTRGDLARHTEGNGLGLSIVKSLMDLQNGEVTLDLEGDLFKVYLEFDIAPEQTEEMN